MKSTRLALSLTKLYLLSLSGLALVKDMTLFSKQGSILSNVWCEQSNYFGSLPLYINKLRRVIAFNVFAYCIKIDVKIIITYPRINQNLKSSFLHHFSMISVLSLYNGSTLPNKRVSLPSINSICYSSLIQSVNPKYTLYNGHKISFLAKLGRFASIG